MDQSREDALRRRTEREREHCARETPEQRDARLYQRRLRDRERARERLATETAEEREARLARRRVQAKSRLAAESWGKRSSNTSEAIEKGELLHRLQRRERGLPIRCALPYLTEAAYNSLQSSWF